MVYGDLSRGKVDSEGCREDLREIAENGAWIEKIYAAVLKSLGDILLGVGKGSGLLI